MPKFTSEKEPVQKLGGGVELHTKNMFCDGILVEVRRSFRGEGGTSVSHTNVRQDWTQPVHKHLRTTETTMVLAGRVLNLRLGAEGDLGIFVHKAGSVIYDELGVFHTLYVTAGTQLSTSKAQTVGHTDDKPDWHGDPAYDELVAKWDVVRMLRYAGVTPEDFYA